MPEMRRLGSNSVVALPVVLHNNATQQERHARKKVQVGPMKINRRWMRDARQPVMMVILVIALMMNQEPVQTTFQPGGCTPLACLVRYDISKSCR